jgi:LDH2 family malate/lactate/ureidoglycolate dehydrogenase
LTLLVDILTGVLGGTTPGPLIAPLFSEVHGAVDLSQTFVAIDPEVLDEPGAFEKRMEHEIELLVGARTARDAPGRVLIPGEPEAAAERRTEVHGVSLDLGHLESLRTLAERYDLPLPETTPL